MLCKSHQPDFIFNEVTMAIELVHQKEGMKETKNEDPCGEKNL
jgi:hypothetical protein